MISPEDETLANRENYENALRSGLLKCKTTAQCLAAGGPLILLGFAAGGWLAAVFPKIAFVVAMSTASKHGDEAGAIIGFGLSGCGPQACSSPGNAARFDWSRANHIFRSASGHVNPASAGSRARYARLFEGVASNAANLRTDAVQAGLITEHAAQAGVRVFTYNQRTGQVWVTVHNGRIQNAGVNPVGAFR